MKEELYWEFFVKCRFRLLFIMIYKISNKLIDILVISYLILGDNRIRGVKYNVLLVIICEDVYKFFFFLELLGIEIVCKIMFIEGLRSS